MRSTPTGFEVLATEGLSDAGGLDIDEAVVNYIGKVCAARNPAAWNQLANPTTSAQYRFWQRFWDDVRAAKETLSRTSQAFVHVPLVDMDVVLGRADIERLGRPVLDRTVATTNLLLQRIALAPQQLGGMFLVGGGSRMPLAASLLHRALGVAPTVLEQPELVVAQGTLLVGPADTINVPAATTTPALNIRPAATQQTSGRPTEEGPPSEGPTTGGPAPAPPPRCFPRPRPP